MRSTGVFILFSLLSGFRGAAALGGVSVTLQPVRASGVHTIIGSEIFLPAGGQLVWVEVRIAGWRDAPLETFQVTINSSGFENGFAPLSHALVPCPSNNAAGHAVCAQVLEAGSLCQVGCAANETAGCRCETGFQNKTRPDWILFGISSFSAVDISRPNYRFGGTTDKGDIISDPGFSRYGGTFVVHVPADAQGVYEIGIMAAETFLHDKSGSQNPIPIDVRFPVRLVLGDPVVPGSRFMAYAPRDLGEETAVRVVLTSMYHPGPPVAENEDRDFSALEGQVRWLGPPQVYPDVLPGSSLVAAELQCAPYFHDWASVGEIRIFGDSVLPSSVYSVREVPVSCADDPDDPLCFSAAVKLRTGQWGDVFAPFARSDQPAQPDMADLGAIIDSYRRILSGVSKARSQLSGHAVNPADAISFIDVVLAADAVLGFPYPYAAPSPCP